MADGELIYGFRRLHAAKMVGLPDLEVTIYEERLSAAEIKIIQLTENIHRLEMRPFEKFLAYEQLRALNPDWTARDMADHLKLDPSTVTKWLSPAKCIAEWRQALRSGQVGISDCYAASLAATEEQQRDILKMKLAGATRDEIVHAVRANRNPTANSVRLARVKFHLPQSGINIIASGAELSLDDLVEAFSEAQKEARKALNQGQDIKSFQAVMTAKNKNRSV